MGLILTEHDLRPVLDHPSAMDGMLEAVEQGFRDFQQGDTNVHPIVRLRLSDGTRQLGVLPITATGTGPTLRLYPLFAGGDQRADSRLLLLFDVDDGQLLAVIANDELNAVRTGAAGGVGARHLAPAAVRTVGL
jgi:alanine dehydrogenase